MQVEMTERDKRLIVMLSVLVLIVGFGWWGIRPALKNEALMKAELEEEEELQEINMKKLAMLPMYASEAEETEKQTLGEREHYFPRMSASEIDRYFTGMILERGMSSYDLTIRIASDPAPVEPYRYSTLAAVVEAAQDMPEDDSDSEGTEEEEDPFDYTTSPAFNSEIYPAEINLRLAGDKHDLMSFIEELSKSEKLILVENCVWTEEVSMLNDYSDFSMDEETEAPEAVEGGEEGEGEGTEEEEREPIMVTTTVLNLNLIMYMCDQTEAGEEE